MLKRILTNRHPGAGGLIALLLFLFALLPRPEAGAAERVTLFVTSERTDTVGVYRGTIPDLKRIKRIGTGRDPHNAGISPNGRWVVTSDRLAKQVSVIDTASLRRVAKLATGRHPHDLGFSPDSGRLFVGHERENYINVFETGSWKKLPPIHVGVAQHDITLSPDARELWFTVTHRRYRKGEPRVGIVDLASKERKVTMLDSGDNAHDVIFSPDGRTIWVTNGGFIGHPNPIVHYIDAASRRVLGQLRVGKYPFHTPKRGRDGNYVPEGAKVLWFSDRGTSSVIAVESESRRVVASVPVGRGPFHITITPGGILLVANHDSHTVTIVDGAARRALGTLSVDKEPHGLAVLAGP